MQLRKNSGAPGKSGDTGLGRSASNGRTHEGRHRAVAAIAAVLAALALAFMGLCRPVEATASGTDLNIVVSGTTVWQYRDDNAVPADGWKTSAATTDTSWKQASGTFGAKNGAIADLGNGITPSVLLTQYMQDGNDIPVYYFRTTFDVANPTSITGVSGQFAYDDAATIYINGVRVGGADDSSFDANGYGGSNASAPQTAKISFDDIASLNLKQTGNVVAVELHNGRASSSDIYFDLTKLTLTTQDHERTDDIKDVEFAVGSNETQRNFNWLATSKNEAYVEYMVKPSGYTTNEAFPEDQATKVAATQDDTDREGYVSNKATVEDIQAATTYIYRVGNEDKWSDVYQFTTGAQGTGSSFSFLFAGDPQIGAGGNVPGETLGWTNTLDRAISQLGTDFVVSAGDQVNKSTTIEQYDGYYAPNALKSYPQATTVGNHDASAWGYTDYNNMPNVSSYGATTSNTGYESGDYWYTYNGVLFMDLNSNNTTTSEHKTFMQEAINANPDATWKIVVFHHSVFSVANHYSDTDIIQRRAELPAVFSELGIDAVLMGHDHYYTRTYMIDGLNGNQADVPAGYDVAKGEAAPSVVENPAAGQVFYLTANSASGSKYYKLNGEIAANGMPRYVAVQDQSNRPSITSVSVTADSLQFDTYYTDSAQLEQMDSFTIKRTAAVAPTIKVPAADVEVKVGQNFDPLACVSATASDGTDLTDSIQYTITDSDGNKVGAVDTSKEGVYTVEYSVTDARGTIGTASVKVTVVKDAASQNNSNTKGTSVDAAANGKNGSSSNGMSGTAQKTASRTAANGGSVPNTNDTVPYGLIAACAAAGMVLVIVSIHLYRKNRSDGR